MNGLLAVATALVLGVPIPSVVYAQGTDFSGTWTLDRDASDLPQRRSGRGGRRSGPGIAVAATTVINQSNNALIIEQQSERTNRSITYRLDGSQTTNTRPRGNMTTASRWNGAVLVTTGSQQFSTPRGDFTIEFTERRTLSNDGQTMTIESTRRTPRGNITITLIYNKSTT